MAHNRNGECTGMTIIQRARVRNWKFTLTTAAGLLLGIILGIFTT